MRYERSRPGSLVHMDTKKLARIERPGHRIDGDRPEPKSVDSSVLPRAAGYCCTAVVNSGHALSWTWTHSLDGAGEPEGSADS